MRNSFYRSVAIALAIVLSPAPLLAQKKPADRPSPIVAGHIVTVHRVSVESFVGTLQAKRKSVVGTAVDGRVIALEVERGDPVGQDPESVGQDFVGQPLMRLRTATLDIEIATAEIQLKLAQQAAVEMTVLLPREIELAKAGVSEAKAHLEYSKANFERVQRLGGTRGAISQGELEQARSQDHADQHAADGEDIDYRKLIATRELRLQQASLRIESSRMELTRLNDLKAKYTIRAPFEGFVTEKLTEVGEWVTQGQPIVEVTQIDPIEMVVNVPQKYLPRLQESISRNKVGTALTADIMISGFENSVTGIVKRIVGQADLRSRTFPVRLELDNPKTESGYRLQPGMLGKATFQIGVEREMMLVKKDALVLGGRQPTVYKIIQNGKEITAIPIAVTTGTSVGDWIQITGNIDSNDKIVLLGNERLRPGQKLLIKETSDEVPPS